MAPRFTIRVEAGFEAAHALRQYRGAGEPVHGHSWKIALVVGSEALDQDGLAVDFVPLQSALRQELARFAHRNLNEVEPFDRINPSAENLAVYLAGRLRERDALGGGTLLAVEVWEGPGCCASYQPA